MVMALRNLAKFVSLQLLFHMLGMIIIVISVVMGNLVSRSINLVLDALPQEWHHCHSWG